MAKVVKIESRDKKYCLVGVGNVESAGREGGGSFVDAAAAAQLFGRLDALLSSQSGVEQGIGRGLGRNT